LRFYKSVKTPILIATFIATKHTMVRIMPPFGNYDSIPAKTLVKAMDRDGNIDANNGPHKGL
jgi:hypothetical protein